MVLNLVFMKIMQSIMQSWEQFIRMTFITSVHHHVSPSLLRKGISRSCRSLRGMLFRASLVIMTESFTPKYCSNSFTSVTVSMFSSAPAGIPFLSLYPVSKCNLNFFIWSLTSSSRMSWRLLVHCFWSISWLPGVIER